MKAILGIILIVLGVIVGLYVGLWLMFIGGIIDVIDFIKMDFEPYSILAWGIVKIMLAGLAGHLSAMLLVVPGWGLIEGW